MQRTPCFGVSSRVHPITHRRERRQRGHVFRCEALELCALVGRGFARGNIEQPTPGQSPSSSARAHLVARVKRYNPLMDAQKPVSVNPVLACPATKSLMVCGWSRRDAILKAVSCAAVGTEPRAYIVIRRLGKRRGDFLLVDD